jgi:hypothetical protein
MARSRVNSAINRNGKRPVGPPKGSRNHETHGIMTFKNAVQRRMRRGRSVIDKRSKEGQRAEAFKQALIEDLGGIDNLSAAKLRLIDEIARDHYLADEIDRRVFKMIHKIKLKEQSLNTMADPKQFATFYSYRSASHNLMKNLALLGLEKVKPPPKTLEQLLSEDEPTEGESP